MPAPRSVRPPTPPPGAPRRPQPRRPAAPLTLGMAWILLVCGACFSAMVVYGWAVLGAIAGWLMGLPTFSPWPPHLGMEYAIMVVPWVLGLGVLAGVACLLAGRRLLAFALSLAPGLYTLLVLAWFVARAIWGIARFEARLP